MLNTVETLLSVFMYGFRFHPDSLQEDPVAFERQYNETPVQALQRVEEVLSLYLHLITSTNTSVNWTCEQEYSSNDSPTATPLTTSTGECTHIKKKQVH